MYCQSEVDECKPLLNGDDLEEGSAPLPLADGGASRAVPVSSP